MLDRSGLGSSVFGLGLWFWGLDFQRPKSKDQRPFFLWEYSSHIGRFRDTLNRQNVRSCAHIGVMTLGRLMH